MSRSATPPAPLGKPRKSPLRIATTGQPSFRLADQVHGRPLRGGHGRSARQGRQAPYGRHVLSAGWRSGGGVRTPARHHHV
jgi:hypothetical protein